MSTTNKTHTAENEIETKVSSYIKDQLSVKQFIALREAVSSIMELFNLPKPSVYQLINKIIKDDPELYKESLPNHYAVAIFYKKKRTRVKT